CFSHLRWDFVYQRPQHLMSRFAKHHRVFFLEESVYHEGKDMLKIRRTDSNIVIAIPMLNKKIIATRASLLEREKKLMNFLISRNKITNFISWYYTPMALKFSDHLIPLATVYDCMDELSAFKFAPQELKIREAELFNKADVVFTGGNALFKAKKNYHANIHAFPSSIDKSHFEKARRLCEEPQDQAAIPGPRFGFQGVLDERFNIGLIAEVAKQKPDWHFVFVGPVVKIDPAELPKGANIHYLGAKKYEELPAYLSGWDMAIIPFEKNDSTKFISPTKTPEYLAAGKPVISSSITDVVHPYGEKNLVHIADDATSFIACATKELSKSTSQVTEWLLKVDDYLKPLSWDNSFHNMKEKVDACVAAKRKKETDLKSV
ncbi:MAG: glycosyltransferase family 1 protein, partial [Chitinophagaceae bacterium]